MHLNELKTGQEGKIEGLTDQDLALSLMEHGFMPNQKVKLLYAAPFGGPLAIQVNENVVSLRIEEATTITLKSL